VQPVVASSAKTSPLSLATKTREPTMTGCERAELTPGKPNAHFSFSRGTIAALKPPLAIDCERVFSGLPPHPFHPVRSDAAVSGRGAAVQRPTVDAGAAAPTGRPARNAATARRSMSESSEPWRNILPLVSVVRIASGANCARRSRCGARDSGIGLA
jgi:hypothetical protein